MVQRQSSKSKQELHRQYFDSSLRLLVIDQDERGVFALVPSQTHDDISYRVSIDENDPRNVHASKCNCPAKRTCKHMEIVNRFYQRILHPQPKPAVVVSPMERAPLNPRPDWLNLLPSRQVAS